MNRQLIKDLNRFSLPLIIQMLFTYLIGATDVAIVGRISIEAFNATSLIMGFFYTLSGILGSITIVLNMFLGRCIGEKDENRFSIEFITSIFLSVLIGSIVLIILLLFGKDLMLYLYNLDKKTLIEATKYLNYMSFYVLLQLLIFAHTSTFKVLNKTKYILYVSILSSILDVGLDYIFVLGKFGLPKMGVDFVGFTTILSMILSVIFYSFLLRDKIKFRLSLLNVYTKNMINQFKKSIVFIIQEILEGSLTVVIVDMIVIRMGNIDYAAWVIINTILGMLFLFKYTYGSSLLSTISIHTVSDNKEIMRKFPFYSSTISIILYFILFMIIMIFESKITGLFTKDYDVISLVKKYILFFIIIYSISCISYQYKTALQASNEEKFVLHISIILSTLSIIFMYSLTNILKLGFTGLIISIFTIEFCYTIIFVMKYKRKYNTKIS